MVRPKRHDRLRQRPEGEKIAQNRGYRAMELFGRSSEELRAFCQSLGEPGYRGAQLYHALYAKRNVHLVTMSNLPTALRERLSLVGKTTLPSVKRKYASTDGTVR